MNTTVERQDGATLKVTIEATAEEVAPALKRAVEDLGRRVKIPGFRAGKAPRKVLEGRVGRDALKDQVVQLAIPDLLGKAVEEEGISSISQPQVNVTSYELDSDLTFEATLEVKPEIPEPNYSILHVEVPSTEATEEEISEQLSRIQDRFATVEPVDRAAARGDLVRIDITTTVDDQTPEALQATDQLYPLGQGQPIPDLDDHLQGEKAGSVVEFETKLPENLGEFGGKDATVKVMVKEVNQKIVPDLDDSFASDASEFDTLEELKADISQKIREVKEQQSKQLIRSTLLDQAVNDTDFSVPQSMIMREMAFRLQRFEQNLQQNGLTLEQYLQEGGYTEEQVEQDLRKQSEQQMRAMLLLESIAEREGFKLDQEELAAEMTQHAQAMRLNQEQAKRFFSDQDQVLQVAGDIIRRKALDHLVERAGYGEDAAVEADRTDGGDDDGDEENA
ncbi:MAG: trigger factor [Actinomycetota bacterium]